MSKSTTTMAHEDMAKTIKALFSISNAREASKSRELELVQTRKDLENQLDALGAGNTSEHLRVSRDYVVTLRSIDFERDRIRSLADKMDSAVKAAIQGKFEFADDLDEREIVRRPKEAELFHAPPPPPEKEHDDRPVGRSKKQPEAPQPMGENQHLEASVLELDMRDQLKVKCNDAGFSTIGQLAQIVDGVNAMTTMSEKLNVEVGDATMIIKAVAAFRVKHRKAMIAKELGEENPPDNRAKVGGKGAKPPKGGL